MKKLLLFIITFSSIAADAQILTKEDSLAAGLVGSNAPTVISGYGSAQYKYDINHKTAGANLDRVVLFLGHRFTNKISFFSELEVEDAKVAGGEPGGEVALEQAFLKYNVSRNIYITTGLFIPRLGIINENHLPTTFNGNDRTAVETFIIPSTWRELGICLYGNAAAIPGLNYSVALSNGLNSAGFEHGSGIREGRFEGRNANASALAVTGAVLYYIRNFRIQGSVYYGGSAGLAKKEADSLQLSYGAFGTPVALYEANVQYHNKGWAIKALYTTVQIADAKSINLAYANNTPQAMVGYYAELGYNLFQLFEKTKANGKSLMPFVRYENLDMNHKLPDNAIFNGTLNQTYVVGGLTFQPIKGVSIKADYIFKKTGDQNPALVVNPYPAGPQDYKQQGYFSLGMGYSF
jgi:hypothetical protein